jgi:hypothetical protein
MTVKRLKVVGAFDEALEDASETDEGRSAKLDLRDAEQAVKEVVETDRTTEGASHQHGANLTVSKLASRQQETVYFAQESNGPHHKPSRSFAATQSNVKSDQTASFHDRNLQIRNRLESGDDVYADYSQEIIKRLQLDSN